MQTHGTLKNENLGKYIQEPKRHESQTTYDFE